MLKDFLENKKAAIAMEVAEYDKALVDLEAEKKAEFDKGFDEGVKQVSSPGDKIYSEAELQAELLPLKDKIAALESSMASLQAQVDAAPVAQAKAVADAEAVLKAQFIADLEDFKLKDDANEDALIGKYK